MLHVRRAFHWTRQENPTRVTILRDLITSSGFQPLITKSVTKNCSTNWITKLENGRQRLNVDKPMFKEDKEMFERKYFFEKQKRYPRTVMKGLYFQNLDAAFENALNEDENTRRWTKSGKAHGRICRQPCPLWPCSTLFRRKGVFWPKPIGWFPIENLPSMNTFLRKPGVFLQVRSSALPLHRRLPGGQRPGSHCRIAVDHWFRGQ